MGYPHFEMRLYKGMMSAISTVDGSYIGTKDYATQLAQRGIAPQARPGSEVASIGFCRSEQKWYGWSHRAMRGFGVGSEVKFGDCAYVAKDWYDLVRCAIEFWSDPGKLNIQTCRAADENDVMVVQVEWTYSDDPELIPNEKLHGQPGSAIMYPPDEWGRGEWKAETLEDAKQMAMDFAEGVS